MRASRLLSLLLLLQNRGRMTAEALAAELEVSVRTVYRDVDSLSAAGVPVYGEPGRDGGYRLVDGYRTRLTGLSPEEAQSLVLAGLPDAAAELGMAQALAAARLKVQAALPDPQRDRAQAFHERFHIDAPGWYGEPEQVPRLAALVEAILQQLRIRIVYRRWAAPHEVERLLEPYGVVLKAGRWYAVARTEGGFRTYRVSKILELEPAAESGRQHFERQPFDLAAHWRAYTADYDARRLSGSAEIRLSPAGLERLPDLLDAPVVRAALAAARPEADGGWSRTTLPIESVPHAHGELLRLGADVEVLAPPELRARMAASARAMRAVYADGVEDADDAG
ncbi:helix-turn-helix transcriptional regulator [Streptacidiphilus sp. EB129]|jgi:predicted DNA-binding transcriptional regulator YafY|uniref:helix-turn-helix transcriptional regulator n=1 Tax=Streptacidiphilus sp. EB129 TaxID=3156262 RepID=UPI003518CB84